MDARSGKTVEIEDDPALAAKRKELSLWERVVYEARRNPLARAGMMIIFLSLVAAILAPYLSPYDPLSIDLPNKFLPPSGVHLFGTDDMGRDLLSRCLHGMRVSLRAAFIVLSLACSIGIIVGGLAGYTGGRLDNVLMRITDMFLAFPVLVLALAIAAALGASLTNAMIAVTAAWWPWYSRLVRGQVLSVKNNLYIDAARVCGATDLRILFRHILPNCVSPILVMLTMDVGFVILMTASLSFLGLGAKPPTPELGAMISSGRLYFREKWWVPTFPGLTIFTMVLGANLLGDAWRDILDPRLRHR